MIMKLKIAVLLLICIISSCEIETDREKSIQMTHEEIIQKYAKEGAWRVGDMFSQEWQDKLNEGLSVDSTVAYLWQQKAMPLFKQMKYKKGLEYLDHAVLHDREKWLEYRGFMKYLFVKDYSSAIEDFQQCIDEFGDQFVMDHKYSFYIAISKIQLNEYLEAEEILRKGIEVVIQEEGYDWVHFLDRFYLGIALYEQKKYEIAIVEFDEVLEVYPEFSDAMFYKAMSLRHLGKEEEGMSLARIAKQNQAYTINEDNVLYERYPYQVNWKTVWWLD